MLLSNVKIKNVTGSDLYLPLINLWKLIRDKPEEVIQRYDILWNKLQQEVSKIDLDRDKGKIAKIFYKCREKFIQTENPFFYFFI